MVGAVGISQAAALSLGELPVWEGVQEHPGFQTLPFTFELEQGVIRLDRHAADVRGVLARYGSSAYTFISTPPGRSEWGDRLGHWYVRTLADALGDLAGKTVLEIGSGTTYIAERVVRELHAQRVILCDPAMRPEQGGGRLEVVPEYFEAARFSDRRIDAVVSINNLEHVADPFRYLADVRMLLEPGHGRCFVVLPECARQLRAGDWGMCVHEHLSYFTEGSFTSAVRRAGFAVARATIAEDTLLGLLVPVAAGSDAAPWSDAELLARAMDRFRRNLGHARRRIAALSGDGRRLGIHGCTVGLNNLLARLGIRADPRILLFDGDRAKTGRHLPAFDSPIRHAEDPAYRTITDLLIAATTFYDEIRAFAIRTHGIAPDRIEPICPLA